MEDNFILSHINISRSNILILDLYIYDGFLEEWRVTFVKKMFEKRSMMFSPLPIVKRKPSFFANLQSKSKLEPKRRNRRYYRLKTIFRSRRAIRKYRYLKLPATYRRKFILQHEELEAHRIRIKHIQKRKKKKKDTFHKFKQRLARIFFAKYAKKNTKRSSRRFHRNFPKHATKKAIKLRIFPPFLYDLIFQSLNPLFFLSSIKNTIKLLKICLITFSTLKRASFKKQFFFITLFKKSLYVILTLPLIGTSFFILKILNLLFIKEFSYRHFNVYYFEYIFKERFLIFQGASLAIASSIKAFDKNDNVVVSFNGLHVRNTSALMITNYILVKLDQYFTIFDILRPILRELKQSNTLNGFRIVVAGRLTRKERAAYILRQHGRVTLGTKSKFIDYATDAKIMRFGVVGVKVWFHLRKSYPHSYNFRFTFKKEKKSNN